MTDPAPGPLARNVAMQIRARRERQGWTTDVVAQKTRQAGVPWLRQTVSKLETGARQLLVDELAAIAEVFGVDNPWDLTRTVPCEVCCGSPPAGFRCLTCDRAA